MPRRIIPITARLLSGAPPDELPARKLISIAGGENPILRITVVEYEPDADGNDVLVDITEGVVRVDLKEDSLDESATIAHEAEPEGLQGGDGFEASEADVPFTSTETKANQGKLFVFDSLFEDSDGGRHQLLLPYRFEIRRSIGDLDAPVTLTEEQDPTRQGPAGVSGVSGMQTAEAEFNGAQSLDGEYPYVDITWPVAYASNAAYRVTYGIEIASGGLIPVIAYVKTGAGASLRVYASAQFTGTVVLTAIPPQGEA